MKKLAFNYLNHFGYRNIMSMNIFNINEDEFNKLDEHSDVVTLYQKTIIDYLNKHHIPIPIKNEWVLFEVNNDHLKCFSLGLFEKPEYRFSAHCVVIIKINNEPVEYDKYLNNINGDWFDLDNQLLSNDIQIKSYQIL